MTFFFFLPADLDSRLWCQDLATRKNLKFSTNENPEKSKAKCLVFSQKANDRLNNLPVHLDGNPLPWVSQVKHLGNLLQLDNSMKVDMSQKRGKFIGKMSSLFQEFHYVDTDIFVKIMNIFNTSFYGSNLWDILSNDCDRLYKSWNVAIRQAFDVNRCTHRYLIESISKSMHPKVMLSSRYVAFHRSLISSTKLPVRFLARLFEKNQRTVLGKTLYNLSMQCSLPDITLLTPECVKKNLKYFSVPEHEKWRSNMVTELFQLRDNSLSLPDFSHEDNKTILEFVLTS